MLHNEGAPIISTQQKLIRFSIEAMFYSLYISLSQRVLQCRWGILGCIYNIEEVLVLQSVRQVFILYFG